MARNPQAAGLPADVEVVRGDLTVPESLDAPLDGIDTVFLLWFAPPDAVAAALDRIAIPARRIVFLSSPHKTPHPFFQGSQPNRGAMLHAEIERRIEASGCRWTFLRPGMFAINAIEWWGPKIRAGEVVRWPYAGVATAPIHERDIAGVAVRALCDEGHHARDYVITGPEALTHAEQVATIGRATGRAIGFEEMSPEEAQEELPAVIPAPVVQMLLAAWGAAAGHPAYMTSNVETITGRPARTYYEWAVDHAAAFLP
jgi:uncharacterized protein YbjT (DUF2867 family)